MALDFSTITPDDLAALKAMLGLPDATDASGRSPFKPRQLHNLTILPRADDPRPTFFMSAEAPRNGEDLTKTKPFPRLMWETTTGREITVKNVKEQETYTAQGFIVTPPANAETPEPFDVMREALEGLSETDRALVIKGAHATRLDRLKDGLLGLTDEEREALTALLTPEKARKSA